MATPHQLAHYTTLANQALKLDRFQTPTLADERIPVAEVEDSSFGAFEQACASFDSDDIVDLFKHVGASAQELSDLHVMLQSVIDNARQQGRGALRRDLMGRLA
jgi:hypothetical protein